MCLWLWLPCCMGALWGLCCGRLRGFVAAVGEAWGRCGRVRVWPRAGAPD